MKLETIFALSSGAGLAGVAVIRISGPRAGDALVELTGKVLPDARRAVVRTLRSPVDGGVLDRALCLWFPGQQSFTGEPVVELQVHGGVGVVAGVLQALAECSGLRLAAAGEFSRRAFDHGKLDLAQVEAVGDLIAARTAAQVRQALAQDEGPLGRAVLQWRSRLVSVLAQVESAIDFVDEDLGAIAVEGLAQDVSAVVDEIETALAAAQRGAAIRAGYTVVILGQPNVGKSTLLNRLAGLDAAIVSTTAGTTRDVVQVEMSLGGVLVRLCDTAGLRSAGDAIEREGVARALALANRCDLALLVVDGDGDSAFPEVSANAPRLLVRNKVDLLKGVAGDLKGAIGVSALDGTGIARLVDQIVELLGVEESAREPAMVSRQRHQDALEEVCGVLRGLVWSAGLEVVADDLLRSMRELEAVVGVGVSEDVLDAVFAEFCIGK